LRSWKVKKTKTVVPDPDAEEWAEMPCTFLFYIGPKFTDWSDPPTGMSDTGILTHGCGG
jgi:hypothetical protein